MFFNKLEKKYKKIYNNEFGVIKINRLLNNNIKDYYTDDEMKTILLNNPIYQKIKQDISKEEKRKKCIIFKQYQNAKHYDGAIKIYDKKNKAKIIYWQSTFNKSIQQIKALINNLFIDINFMNYKSSDICDKNYKEISEVYIFFVLFHISDERNSKNELKSIINQHNKSNESIINIIKNYKINCIILNNDGDLFQKGNILKQIITNKKDNLFIELKMKLPNVFRLKISNEKKYLAKIKDFFQILNIKKYVIKKFLYYPYQLKGNTIKFVSFPNKTNDNNYIIYNNKYFNNNYKEMNIKEIQGIELTNKEERKESFIVSIEIYE